MKKKIFAIVIILLGALLASLLGFYGRNKTDSEVISKKTDSAVNAVLEDGEYELPVTLTGGSGKTTLLSPCKVLVKDGKISAEIIFSSENYDYVIVAGEKILATSNEGGSKFIIPVENIDEPLDIIGDTTAMSKPHEVEYKIYFGDNAKGEGSGAENKTGISFSDMISADKVSPSLQYENSLELKYAKLFKIDYFRGGYSLISIADDGQYLVVPKGERAPKDLPESITVITAPFDKIYVVGTGSMGFFIAADCLSNVKFCSLKAEDWELPEAKEAVFSGKIKFAGKYKAPDYEMLLADGCNLIIENNMINHTPQVREKLIELGFCVITEKASYEEHPLGRSEWIKLIGELCGKREAAMESFEAQALSYEQAVSKAKKVNNAPKVGIFYVTSSGNICIRKAGDYMVKMIENLGAEYVFSTLSDENDTGSMTVQNEAFLMAAKEADILIYNSSIAGEVSSISELEKLNPSLTGAINLNEKAVYCTSKSLYQSIMMTGEIESELGDIFEAYEGSAAGEADTEKSMEYFVRLR